MTELKAAAITLLSYTPQDSIGGGGLLGHLNENNGAYSVVLALVVAVLTGILLLYNHRSDTNATKMLRSAELQRLNSTLPVLAIAIDVSDLEWHDTTTAAFPVHVVNTGAGPAISPMFDWATNRAAELHPGPSTTAIGAGMNSIRVWITHKNAALESGRNNSPSPENTPGSELILTNPFSIGRLRITYSDVNGRDHWSEFQIGYITNHTGMGIRPTCLRAEYFWNEDPVPSVPDQKVVY